ncbi:MAG: hypothetical protein IIB00_09610, partial [candidate division Zixibacteria bacterium]|nr:hypothetical protein [candidate division Zixibacteria bacterium]
MNYANTISNRTDAERKIRESSSNTFPRNCVKMFIGALLAGYFLLGSPTHAVTDYIFFSVNGDTTSPALTQGDALSWGANCDIGTTIFFEIWYDVNSNSVVDPSTDVLLDVFKITDGVTFDEGDINPIPDGLVQTPAFVVSLHPGPYIFRAENSSDNTTTTRVLVNSVMTSPPNKIKGQITVPGHPAPDNAVLANVWVFAEPETEEAFYAALTNDSGFYEMNIGAIYTGDSSFVEVEAISGFATPVEQSVVTTGVVSNIDFAYNVPADSVYGFLKDDGGTVITRYSFVGCNQFPTGLGDKEARTESGRYVINFSAAELGDWNLQIFLEDFTPEYVIPNGFFFSHDTLNSFQHDIVVTRADTTLYVKVTESGGLPVNEYAIDVSSEGLKSFTRGISGTGSNNVLALSISSLDSNGWSIFVGDQNEDYPIPAGSIVSGQLFGLSPGDTATVNLIQGKLVTGTLVQDPEDAPINWSQVQVSLSDYKGFYSSFADAGGMFTVYTDTGTYFMSVFAPGYITNPAWRNVIISIDSTGGQGFIVNETHARVTGTLVNVSTPLSSS